MLDRYLELSGRVLDAQLALLAEFWWFHVAIFAAAAIAGFVLWRRR